MRVGNTSALELGSSEAHDPIRTKFEQAGIYSPVLVTKIAPDASIF